MEKKVKLFKTITIIFIVIAISLISFIGVFRTKLNFKENIIPEFKYGMELKGDREFKFVLDTASEEKNIYVDENGLYKGTVIENEEDNSQGISLETTVEDNSTDNIAVEEVSKVPYNTEKREIKANEDNVLNKEAYEKTKNIIQKRLEKAQISEYNIRLNTITGDLILEVPDDDYTKDAYNLVSGQGKFELIDAQTGIILLDNSHIKEVKALYTANNSYQAYLEIDFNDEGSDILKKISKEYVKTTDETGEENKKNVEMRLDDSTLLSTYFGEELDQGILQITMGSQTSNYEDFIESYKTAEQFANIVNSGKTPNKLAISSDNFVQSQITEEEIVYAKIAFAIVIIIISVILFIKYKKDSIFAIISSIGYIAVTMLIIRYTNVTITLNSILAILGITAINYVFIFDFLNKKKKDSPKHAFIESIKKLNMELIPVWIVSIIFTFMTHIAISSVGMILFWGLFVHCIYSFAVTRTLYI